MSELEKLLYKEAERTLALIKELPTKAGEDNHMEADSLLSEFVRRIGFTEIAKAYDEIGKWYA